MADPIQTICSLTGCSEEEAKRAFDETEDVVEAVDRLLEKKPSAAEKFLNKKRTREVTPEEEIIGPVRKIMKLMDEKISTSLYRPLREELAEMRDRHEETVQQNNYSQECLLPSLELKAETQGIACPSQSEYSSGLQSNGQTLPCSDHQSLQLSQDQGKE